MSLSQKIAAALDDQGANLSSPTTLVVDDGSQQLTLVLELATPIGVRCQNLEFSLPSSEPRPISALRRWAERVAARATYLMEPLKVVEADSTVGEVLLRSEGPTARNGRRAFYEVRIRSAGTLGIARVAFDESTRRREPESFTLTREVLERLVDDVEASAA